MIKELTWVFIMFTRESFPMCIFSVLILLARFTEPSIFRMVEVPRGAWFPHLQYIDEAPFLCPSGAFFSKISSLVDGGLHFISPKYRSCVIICSLIFFIFNFNSWYTSKWFFCNVNISTFLCRS